jgi:uracil-DNA glycosylase
LQAAHGQGVLHRDVKPANLLVRRGEKGLETRLIDFGLALRRTGRETMLASSKTLLGTSIAGTLDYAAPEQMGRLEGEPVSPASDVYGFARTCCFALFQTPQPLMRHWRGLPGPLAELLESCLEEQPRQRPQGFAEVLRVLDRLGGIAPAPVVAPPAPVIPQAEGDGTRRQELAVLARQVAGCTSCQALAGSRTQVVFGAGPVEAPLCFIGVGPGAEEDRSGKPFVGASGRVLAEILAELGIDRSQAYLTNLLKCKTPGNREPLKSEMTNCREHLLRELAIVRPKVLVCLGGPASQSLLNTSDFIGRLRERLHNFRGWPVVCTYHPASLLPGRTPQNRAAVLADLRMALDRLKQEA